MLDSKPAAAAEEPAVAELAAVGAESGVLDAADNSAASAVRVEDPVRTAVAAVAEAANETFPGSAGPARQLPASVAPDLARLRSKS